MSMFFGNNKIKDSWEFQTTGTTIWMVLYKSNNGENRWLDSNNNISTDYFNFVDNSVKSIYLDVTNYDDYYFFHINSDRPNGTIDFRKFTKLTNLSFSGDYNTLSLLFPSNSNALIQQLSVINTKLESDINISGYNRLGSWMKFQNNTFGTNSLILPSVLDSSSLNFSGFYYINNTKTGSYSLDLSMFDKMGGDIRLENNTNLSGITFASSIDSSANNISYFYCYSNPLIETLDLSMFDKLGGNIRLDSNTNLSELEFTSSIDSGANNISQFNLGYNNGLSNNSNNNILDLSMFTKLGGAVDISFTQLSGITFPTVESGANNITTFYCYHNDNIKSLDLSGLYKLGGTILMNQSDLLSGITFPVVTGTSNKINVLNLGYCNLGYVDFSSLSGVSHDGITINMEYNSPIVAQDLIDMMSDIDSFGWTGGTFNNTGNNTCGTHPLDPGTAEYDALESKGWTMINIFGSFAS
jgi:hypothetical protein